MPDTKLGIRPVIASELLKRRDAALSSLVRILYGQLASSSPIIGGRIAANEPLPELAERVSRYLAYYHVDLNRIFESYDSSILSVIKFVRTFLTFVVSSST